MLPYVLALNAPAAPEAERRIAAAFDAPNALDGLQALRDGAGRAARTAGLRLRRADGIADAVEAILPAVPATTRSP